VEHADIRWETIFSVAESRLSGSSAAAQDCRGHRVRGDLIRTVTHISPKVSPGGPKPSVPRMIMARALAWPPPASVLPGSSC
jgi:hypothetical protein